MIAKILDVMVTMVCITHEMGFAKKIAGRDIFMGAGQDIEQNTPNKFSKNPESDRLQQFLDQILP